MINKDFENITRTNNLLKNNPKLLLAELNQKQEEIIIQSEKQSEVNGVISAEGNVTVSYKGKLLKADTLIYDKLNKKISAIGNIFLVSGDQIFQLSKLEYSFISEKGYLLDFKGSINTNTLMDDLSTSFSTSDFNKVEKLLDFKKK